jgi:flagella basal body P-ring formation protein FlgA
MNPLRIFLALALAFGAAAQEIPNHAALVARLEQEALAYAEAGTASLIGSRTFRVLRTPVLPQIRSGEVNFEPSHLSKQDGVGPFFVAFRVLVDGKPAGTARVDLEGRWVGKLLKARSAMPRKAVPGPEDLEEVDFVGTPPAGAITVFPEGSRLKIPVTAGHILLRTDIQSIPVVNAGDPVRLELLCGALSMSVDAVARGNGAVGEKVRVELAANHKSMQVWVRAPGQVQMLWREE